MEYKVSNVNRVIGENLYNLRKSLGLKQESFANELNKILKFEFKIDSNYDYKTISKWEQGKSIPKFEVLIAMSKKYNLSLDELLKDEIKDVVSKTSFSSSEESLLNNFLNNKNVCIKINGKYESSFNPELYKYGQLSYLADNLIVYRSELSKNFSFTNPTKYVQIIVGIMDVNDGKRELHFLGNGNDDIVSVENIPSNYCAVLDVKNQNAVDSIMYDEFLHTGRKQIVKLGNGKCYYLDEDDMFDWNSDDYKFVEGDVPEDLDYYGINKDEFDWTDYASLKGIGVIDDEELFDFESCGIHFFKKAGILAVVSYGKIKCSDAQLVKILTDDYKHRLLKTMEKVSDDFVCEKNFDEIKKYLNKKEVKNEL